MSRLGDFEATPFRQHWVAALSTLDDIEIIDDADASMVLKFATLQKLIRYVEQLIEDADKDLVPLSVWSQTNSPASNLKTSLTNLSDEFTKVQLDAALLHIDQILTFVAPFVVSGKASAQAAGQAYAKYARTVTGHIEHLIELTSEKSAELANLENKLSERIAELDATEEKIKNFSSKYLDATPASNSVRAKLDKAIIDLTEKQTEIEKAYVSIIGDGVDDSLLSKLKDIEADAKEMQTATSDAKEELEDELSEIDELHTEVFGEIDADGERKGGIRKEYADLKSRLREYDESQREVIEALKEEIKGLLPDATTAGLASAYADQRKQYEAPIKWNRWAFYVSIGVLFFIGATALIGWSETDGFTWAGSNGWTSILVSTLTRLPIALPIIWLAYFSTKKINENRRLEEEYAHKEAIAKSYHGFRRQIEELEDDSKLDLASKLLDAAIASVSYNASLSLDGDHDERLPTVDQLGNLDRTFKLLQNLIPK